MQLTGCDTTLALYGHDKVSAFRKLTSKNETVWFASVMNANNATNEEVSEAGCRMLVVIYGGKRNEALNSLRHSMYMTSCATNTRRVLPERLLPTERAAYFRSLRVHFQVLQWKNLVKVNIEATEWGWTLESGKLKPVLTKEVDFFGVNRSAASIS